MGGADKPLRLLRGKPLLAHVLDRLGQPRATTVLSVNASPDRYASCGAALLPDTVAGWPGPLAGILAGLEWLGRHHPEADLLVVPADTPFLPADLLARLRIARASQDTALACAGSDSRIHPVVGLWRACHAAAVRRALESGERRLGRVMQTIGLAVAEFDAHPVDPFFNVNTPEDLSWAEEALQPQAARPGALPPMAEGGDLARASLLDFET